MARSVQRRSVLAGIRELDDEYRVWRPEHTERCRHRLLTVVAIVSMRVEGGYAARCLLCGTSGPVRGNTEAARDVLLEEMVRNAEE
jgi:hypothetical protein